MFCKGQTFCCALGLTLWFKVIHKFCTKLYIWVGISLDLGVKNLAHRAKRDQKNLKTLVFRAKTLELDRFIIEKSPKYAIIKAGLKTDK